MWWWRLLLMRPALNAGTVQTTPKCMGQWEEHVQDRGCCCIPQSEFPSNPHKPSPTPHGLQPPSLVWPEANLNSPHARTNKGWVPALPLWQNVSSRGDTDHKKWPLCYQRSTWDSDKQEGNGRTLWPQRERTYRSTDQQSRIRGKQLAEQFWAHHTPYNGASLLQRVHSDCPAQSPDRPAVTQHAGLHRQVILHRFAQLPPQ